MFLLTFFGPDRAQRSVAFSSIPIMILNLLTNRKVALIYPVTICEQNIKDCARSGKDTKTEFSSTCCSLHPRVSRVW